MEQKEYEQLRQAFAGLCRELQELGEQLSAFSDVVESGCLPSELLVEHLSDALKRYQDCYASFQLGIAALPGGLDRNISEIEAALVAAEEAARLDARRSVVLDYFRLNAEDATIRDVLEQSKQVLMERCRGGGELDPYLLAVKAAKERYTLDSAEFDVIYQKIGGKIALAIERGQLFTDRDAVLDSYLDGSCAMLLAEHTEPPKTSEKEMEILPAETFLPAPSPSEFSGSVHATADPATDRAGTVESVSDAVPVRGAEALWHEFDGYTSAEAVEFTDTPAKQLGASKFISMAKQKTGVASSMLLLGHQMLLEDSDLEDRANHYYAPTAELRRLLMRQGYFMELMVEVQGRSRSFLTMSSKGWACYTKSDVIRYLNGLTTSLIIPPQFRFQVSELTRKNVLRLILLHDYFCCRTPKQNYQLFPFGDERFYLAEQFHDDDICLRVAAAVFDPEDAGRDLYALQRVIEQLDEEDALHIVMCSLADIPRLDAQLDFSSVRKDQVRYCLHGQPEVLLDHSGEPVPKGSEEDLESGLERPEAISIPPEQNETRLASPELDQEEDAEAGELPDMEEKYRRDGLGLLCREKFPEALALFHALARRGEEAARRYRILAYALDDPAMEKKYKYTELLKAFSDRSGEIGYDALKLSAVLRMLFSDDIRAESYHVQSCVRSMDGNTVFETIPQLKELVFCLGEMFGALGRGLDPAVLNALIDVEGQKKQIGKFQSKAKSLLESRLEETNIGNVRIKETRKALFGKGRLLYRMLVLAAEGRSDDAATVRRELEPFLEAEYGSGRVFDADDLSAAEVNALVDAVWEAKADKTIRQRSDALKGAGRNTILSRVREILSVCLTWASLSEGSGATGLDGREEKFRRYHARVERFLLDAKDAVEAWVPEKEEDAACISVLRSTLAELALQMKGSLDVDRDRYYYISFLKGNYVEVGENYMPEMEQAFEETAPYNLCKRIMEQSALGELSWEQVLDRIFTDSAKGRDYGHAALIRDYLAVWEPNLIWPANYDISSNLARSLSQLSARDSEFMAQLEMAQNYGWVEDASMIDRIISDMELRREHYVETGDLGFYFRTMGAYLSRLKRDAEAHRAPWERQLAELRGRVGEEYPIFTEIERLIREHMYTVAQDYMDQVEKEGLRELPESASLSDGNDALTRFLDVYSAYYKSAKESERVKLADIYKKRHRNVENNLVKTGHAMLEAWPKSVGGALATSDKLKALFVHMGLPVSAVTCKADTHYFVTFTEQEFSADYPHPIGAYGSEMLKRGLHVFLLFGSKDATTMNSAIRKLMTASVSGASVILTDTQLTLADKRKLAQTIKQENQNRNPYLIIDRVTILHLAEQPQTERWNVFLKCALPFHYLNPFTENSTMEICPDMFIGRREELERVISPSGANLIYGGRQLGKTALLHHARKLEDHRAAGKWSVFIDIKTESADSAVQLIYEKLQDEDFLPRDDGRVDWHGLARHITKRIQQGEPAVEHFLLLLDEADQFLADCRNVDYHPVVELKRIQMDTDNRFKFVLAGLHNVIRLYDSTADGNSALAHLSPITIRPLPFQEASALLERPLSYLGFKLKHENVSLIAQILSSTNYYPGLIQFYASRLVRSVCQAGYGDVNERPPYWLREDQILTLLKDREFLENIRSKFMITLGIDQNEKGFYKTLAYVLAYCYFRIPEGALHGYTAGQIREVCKEHDIYSINALAPEQVNVLLEELIVLNVLRKNELDGEPYYIFNRATFRHMLGDEDAVEDKLLEIMEKEQQGHGG